MVRLDKDENKKKELEAQQLAPLDGSSAAGDLLLHPLGRLFVVVLEGLHLCFLQDRLLLLDIYSWISFWFCCIVMS